MINHLHDHAKKSQNKIDIKIKNHYNKYLVQRNMREASSIINTGPTSPTHTWSEKVKIGFSNKSKGQTHLNPH